MGGDEQRLDVLDGWRGISILCVLAAHLLPLGPKPLMLNGTMGVVGMSIFFTLSGFLITRFLVRHADIRDFLIRRFFRIVPLACLSILLVFPFIDAPPRAWFANLLFYANLTLVDLQPITSHFWSLDVEVQFYLSIALVVGLFGRRGLWLVPVACVAVTVARAIAGANISVVTWFRVDEILAGAILAMACDGLLGARARHWITLPNPYAMLGLLVLCSYPRLPDLPGWLGFDLDIPAGVLELPNYLRPYVAATMVGATLLHARPGLDRVLKSRFLGYIAAVSYALYVIHGILMHTWLGGGDKLVKYLKRPLLFAATFALAHLSTFYYEQPCIALGKKLSRALQRNRAAVQQA